MAAALTTAFLPGANAPIFSFRWGNATNFALLNYLSVSVVLASTVTVAVAAVIEAMGVSGFTVSDTGGAALTPRKDRFGVFSASLVTDIRMSTTTALTAGTRTLDTNAFGNIAFGTGTVLGTTPLSLNDLYRYNNPSEHPIYFGQNEGFIIRMPVVPATGTLQIAVRTGWTEVDQIKS